MPRPTKTKQTPRTPAQMNALQKHLERTLLRRAVGRDCAMSMTALARTLRCEPRTVRTLALRALRDGLPVVGDTDPKEGGYYIATKPDDAKRAMNELLCRANTSKRRYHLFTRQIAAALKGRGIAVDLPDLMAQVENEQKEKTARRAALDLMFAQVNAHLVDVKALGKAKGVKYIAEPETAKRAQQIVRRWEERWPGRVALDADRTGKVRILAKSMLAIVSPKEV